MESTRSISSRKTSPPESMVVKTPATRKQKKPIQDVVDEEEEEEIEVEPKGKRLKTSSDDKSEIELRKLPIYEETTNQEIKQFERLMEKYKIKIPVLKVKGLKEDQRIVEFTSWKIKMRSVFEYYKLMNVVYRNVIDDAEVPEGPDSRRMTDQQFSVYIMETTGQQLDPDSNQLRILKDK
jgi:hypothetical protein